MFALWIAFLIYVAYVNGEKAVAEFRENRFSGDFRFYSFTCLFLIVLIYISFKY